jgi:structural maintenance of chromosome 2
VQTCTETVQNLTVEVSKLESVVSELRQKYDEVTESLKREKAQLAATDNQLAKLSKHKAKLVKDINESELELKKLAHKIGRVKTDAEDAAKRVEKMMKEFDWIAAERHQFNVKNGDFDFEANDPKKAQIRLTDLKTQQEKLGKTINKKVMGMFEKAEQEYNDLLKKRDIIEKDKKKIEEVMSELDIKKNQALETTWKKVNKDFGAIFSTLLPGTTAKLDPPAGSTVLDGLEMKVAFGGVWKESLSELSGGQRSLIALSLILALLLFKPAPMYILDEIDAALDLSHTQNIGTMLKVHFPMSQFIVVSLKEGMFNNANVVFRTKFVDGVSAVTRTELHHS